MGVPININNVIKKFGDKTVINNLSIDIKPGELFTLLGPSGCGKTTLLRSILGFNSIDSGNIQVNKKKIDDVPVSKRNMGMVFQDYAVFPHMTVKDNIAFGLKQKKVNKPELKKRLDDILNIVQIGEYMDYLPSKLSGGQQQRVALARAIVIQPEVLLMDEPLSNLDAKLRIEMRLAIKEIQQRIDTTTVYVTHDQEEALAISDRIAVMNNGVIQQVGEPKEIYERPDNTFVSTFLGTSNILTAKLVRKNDKTYINLNNHYEEEMSNITDNVHSGDTVLVSVRPQEFIITQNSDNAMKGEVKNSMFLGVNTHYTVELENDEKVEVIQKADEEGRVMPNGTSLFLKLRSDKINVFDHEQERTLIKDESK